MITYRAAKGSDLTPAEVDANFNELDTNKVDKGAFAANNTLLIKNNAGVITQITVANNRIIARLATGEIKAITAAELIGMIFPANTGWGAPTGTATKTTFVTSTVTLSQLAERVKALTDALMAAGIITT